MDKRETSATVYALCAVLLWSTVATAFKLGLTQLTPAQLLLGACVVSTLFFAVVVAFSASPPAPQSTLKSALEPALKPKNEATPSRLRWHAAALGLANPLLYYLVLFEAYDRLPAQLAQPLNYTWAITLALLAVPVLGQRLGLRSIIGISISYFGVVLLLAGASASANLSWNLPGVALALGSTVLWAGYWLASTRSTLAGPELLLVSFAAATPCLGLYCWLVDGLPSFNAHTIVYSLWVGVVEMGLAFLLWQQALRKTSHAARLSQLIFLSPFISLALIAKVLNEPVAASSIIGLAVIVGGIVLARQPVP